MGFYGTSVMYLLVVPHGIFGFGSTFFWTLLGFCFGYVWILMWLLKNTAWNILVNLSFNHHFFLSIKDRKSIVIISLCPCELVLATSGSGNAWEYHAMFTTQHKFIGKLRKNQPSTFGDLRGKPVGAVTGWARQIQNDLVTTIMKFRRFPEMGVP